MLNLWQDLRYGARMLLKRPGFTLIAVFTLALAIGANTAIFSVVNAVLLRPLPFKETDRLVAMWESNPQNKQNEVSAANFIDWREQNQVFEQVAALSYASISLTGGDEPERLQAAPVTPSFFLALGAQASLGRTFLPEEEKPGAAPVVVLSHGVWQRRFAADPTLIGKTVTLNASAALWSGLCLPISSCSFPLTGRWICGCHEFSLPSWPPIAGRTFSTSLRGSNRASRSHRGKPRWRPSPEGSPSNIQIRILARV
jgi:MacB-like periplasmic core domain